jgi:hypothetical protein
MIVATSPGNFQAWVAVDAAGNADSHYLRSCAGTKSPRERSRIGIAVDFRLCQIWRPHSRGIWESRKLPVQRSCYLHGCACR